jgi:hypothetical protein
VPPEAAGAPVASSPHQAAPLEEWIQNRKRLQTITQEMLTLADEALDLLRASAGRFPEP